MIDGGYLLSFWMQTQEKTVLRALRRTWPRFGIQRGAINDVADEPPWMEVATALGRGGGGPGSDELQLAAMSDNRFWGSECQLWLMDGG